jgi:hypothetical protein
VDALLKVFAEYGSTNPVFTGATAGCWGLLEMINTVAMQPPVMATATVTTAQTLTAPCR